MNKYIFQQVSEQFRLKVTEMNFGDHNFTHYTTD